MKLNKYYRAQRQAVRRAIRFLETSFRWVALEEVAEVLNMELTARGVNAPMKDLVEIARIILGNDLDFEKVLKAINVPEF